MKKLLVALALCLLPAAARAQGPQQQPAPQNEPAKTTPWRAPQNASARPKPLEVIPEEVFDSELKDLDARSFFLSNYRGQVFVINLWATWCGPCRMMIPELNRIYKDYRGRGVEFVGLTAGDSEADAQAVRQAAAVLEVKYKLGWVDAETAKRLMYGRPSIPQTFVVAPDGHVVTHVLGYSNRIPAVVRKSIEEALNLPHAGHRP
ncbi:MAG TPA: TlpA disulfide reductase family protein [Pyrinomonadaceae bacterium]|nr:TlpA disulfide reductase family protein [Pyrinomonadaceae bacterium]